MRMTSPRRATLLHNPSAGDARPTAHDLKELLRDVGFEVRYRSLSGDWQAVLTEDADIVVVAGGDGTIGEVARELAGRNLPMGVLPAGTANNVARTLGLIGDARDIAAAWQHAGTRPFDVGTIRAPWKEAQFVESVGGGVFAEAIAHGSDEVEDSSTLVGNELDRAAQLVRQLLDRATPRRWQVSLDGRDASGDYVAVEAMNIRFIGPTIPLASDADTADGLLDVVLVTDEQRRLLVEYLNRRIDDASAVAPSLPVERARSISLQPPPGTAMHVDDEPLTEPEPADVGAAASATFEVTVERGALLILAGTTEVDK